MFVLIRVPQVCASLCSVDRVWKWSVKMLELREQSCRGKGFWFAKNSMFVWVSQCPQSFG